MAGSCVSLALTTLLILIQVATYMNSCLAARPIMPGETNYTQFIKSSCGATTYPDLCFTTLSSYASKIRASPKLLANTALTLTLNTTSSTSTMMTKLSKTKGLTRREAAALKDCVEELRDSVDEIHKSIGEMANSEGKSFEPQMSDIETWVSAALTNEDTCVDGFDGMNGNIKNTVSSLIEYVAQMTSNALALVNYYASHTSPA